MTYLSKASLALFLPAFALASCANTNSGDSADSAEDSTSGAFDFTVTEMGEFDRPWAIEFAPGTDMLLISEKPGAIKIMDTQSGAIGTVGGAPEVAFGGQGGMGDIAFLPSQSGDPLNGRTIYLSWAEAGDGEARGAVVGRGTLACTGVDDCAVEDLDIIWRQAPKVVARGHFSHRITFSPDEKYLFIASGDRQKLEPAQDLTNTLGAIVRLNLDGTPATGNPFADQGGVTAEIWSYGHRNILGMDWDAEGRLWDVEHGPAGGDELNLVARAANYGWPTVSDGDHYSGEPIPDHNTRPEFATAAIGWTPVIAPGDMIFYSGEMFGSLKGQALIAGLSSQSLVRVAIQGDTASEVARYELGGRLRSVEQGPDGSIWVAEDGPDGRILKLSK